ncbi:MAG: hypothetical protein BGO12_07980 [Verrucomicrobia bacterium 61-8]|nr:MAG: hypothetical protein BGO12_07980 [Verrucomicrobia bacterium 61-8]
MGDAWPVKVLDIHRELSRDFVAGGRGRLSQTWLRLSALAGIAGLVTARSLAGPTADSSHRNVLWIVADDMGYGDLSSTGSVNYDTPNIDRIGREGVTMDHAYVYPVCSPSRAALLTGRTPQRCGVESVLLPGYEAGLSAEIPNAAREFAAAGYRTALIGKWHLGDRPRSSPNALGFDEFYGFLWGETGYFSHTKKVGGVEKLDFYQDTTKADQPGYTTDLYTDRAIRFLQENREKPFFLFLAYNAPHYYLDAPASYQARFSGQPQAMYSAVMKSLDDNIGRLLDTLAQLGLDKSTLVIFLSDNGAPANGGGRNAPLRGHKNELLEGGIRTPMFARLPGVIPAGARNAGTFAAWDLLPTSEGLAGLPVSAGFEGRDLQKLLTDPSSGNPEARCFQYTGPGGVLSRAVIKQGWKLYATEKPNGGSVIALYDLDRDPGESRDMAAVEPAKVEELLGEWNKWAKSLSPALQEWRLSEPVGDRLNK